MNKFPPIAIVGRAVVAPGVLSPEELWNAVVTGEDLVSSVPDDRWGICKEDVLCDGPLNSADRTWSDRGGYVRGFDRVFDPEGFAVPVDEIRRLDPVFQWTFHTAREALRDAGYETADATRFGAVFGNLSFPSAGMASFVNANAIAAVDGFGEQAILEAGIESPDPVNRFNSGLPALLLERALGLGSGAFALDAACASSLYAIKLACDQLHDGTSDLMLAGAVNCADDLCIHLGFAALQALSRTGQSRPFHRDADGLVPAEGCGFVALRRLEDAVRDGDTIHGIIRGVGLSNDGRGRGMLVPSSDGQARAISQAFDVSGLSPKEISLLECHATGTQVGDETEIQASATVYGDNVNLPIGSLKSNTGHLITAAGVVGLIKVIEAMRHEVRPPSLHAESPLDVLADSPFRLLSVAETWDRSTIPDGVLRAGVSAFGFGGNNAHLLVEEPATGPALIAAAPKERPEPRKCIPIAIVGIGITAASAVGRKAFTDALLSPERNRPGGLPTVNRLACDRPLSSDQFRMPDLTFAFKDLKFPPKDLKSALSQQLAILQAADEALADATKLPSASTGIYVGMGTDTEAARFGVRWRLATAGKKWGCSAEWIAAARDHVGPILDAAGVMGTMPNIVANRLNSQFDMEGPSFSVSAEERSGLTALDVAARALRAGEIDAAMVGAVDLCCHPIHQMAAAKLLAEDRQPPGDAAVMLVLKRMDDADRDGDRVYAVLPGQRLDAQGRAVDNRPDLRLGLGGDAHSLIAQFGHAHAASGLVHVAAAALLLHHRTTLDGNPLLASNPPGGTGLVLGAGPRTVSVEIDAMDGVARQSVLLAEASDHLSPACLSIPNIHIFTGATPDEVLRHLANRHELEICKTRPASLVIVAADEHEFAHRAERAIKHVTDGHPPGQGVHFRTAPIDGELGFVFTAAGAAYEQMGAELIRAMPELVTPVSTTFPLCEVAGWIYATKGDGYLPSPSDYLWGTSLLSQAHAQLTLSLLKLRPSAAIGYSSGESNSLYAFDVWSDMDAMRQQIDDSGMMEHELGVDFAAVARAWGTDKAEWSVWNILAPVDEVRETLAAYDRVHLAIINTANDVVIGGDASQCDSIVQAIGPRRCLKVDYNLACHVPEVALSFHQPWIDIHTRNVTPRPDVRFYSNGVGGAYQVSEANCASAITAQAETTLDFPATIEAAYADGIRIFVEHGPAGACTKFIGEILSDRDVLCVQLDRRGKNVEQVFDVVAALLVAGVDVDHTALTSRLTMKTTAESVGQSGPALTLTAHPPPINLPTRTTPTEEHPVSTEPKSHQFMAPAPRLPRTDHKNGFAMPAKSPFADAAAPVAVAQPIVPTNAPPAEQSSIEQAFQQQFDAMAAMHKGFIEQQSAVHHQFLAMRTEMLNAISNHSPTANLPITLNMGGLTNGEPTTLAAGIEGTAAVASRPAASAYGSEAKTDSSVFVGQNEPCAIPAPLDRATRPARPSPERESPTSHASGRGDVRSKRGPTWNKEELKIHSSGRISELFGPLFKAQDQHALQCRMPEPPLLLADRVTGLDAKAGELGTGTIWTETDVSAGDWYLNDGYMPAGFMIESGQADLMLISYMGIDLLNQGERVYRLLGCTLTYHGDLPSPGETLEYEIRINGHAKHGDIRLFFFEYDCVVNGKPRLTVRDAQAGFFSYEELEDALGILWTPEQGKADLVDNARVDPPLVACTKSSFSNADLIAFSEGRSLDCFGPGYEWTETHTRSPKMQAGDQLFIDEISEYDPYGGPWGRGFMRCETDVKAEDWFFQGHFKNDPCMPGNFMVEACIEALSFYLAATGHTTKRDGWRFQPLPDQPFELKCRGEINPQTDHVTYEVHVEELWDGPHPTVICDVVGFVDGEAAFHAHRIGVELVPGWPLTTMTERYQSVVEPVQVATDSEGFPFDWKAMISCAWGRPSEAFGSMYKMFDGTRQSPRLPGQPYHFISRITKIDGDLDVCKAGMEIECEYDIPDDVWYFDENGAETMPHAVLLEAALQPCGWVASAVGSVTKLDDDLMFRNLDGTGTILEQLTRTAGVLTTKVKITSVSNAGGMVIEGFDVECFLGDTKVYVMETVFGFFPPAAFENQVGLPITDQHRQQIKQTSEVQVDLTTRPAKYCTGTVRLPEPMLLMIDRATHIPRGGAAGLGLLQGEKDVDVSEWFFKAHFFQDPVQPGSLGIEALIQLLQFYMLDSGMADGLTDAYFEPLMIGTPLTWKYRGQVTPKNLVISSTMEITEAGADAVGPYVIGKGSLWVDGLRIYEASNMGMRISSGKPTGPVSGRQAVVRSSPHQNSNSGPGVVDLVKDPTAAGSLTRSTNLKLKLENELVLRPGRELSQRLREFWNPLLSTPDGWAGEDIVLGLINQYVNRVVVPYPDTIERLQGRPAIFLGNHQVQIESLIATNVIPALTGVPMTTMANAKHQHRWIGKLIDVLESYPGFQSFEQIVYFDQDKPESMFQIVENIKTEMAKGNRSFFVHTDGTRSQSCRDETSKCSSVFLDLALELNVPIVPVRFTGGLPVAPISGKAEFPVGHGRQDYWIGKPIEPEELRALPLRDRVNHVVSAINTLGVTPVADRPYPADAEFAKRAARTQKDSGVHEVFAAIWQILKDSENVSQQTKQLRIAATNGTATDRTGDFDGSQLGEWLNKLAALLLGPTKTVSNAGTYDKTKLVVNQQSHPHLIDHAVNGTPVVPVAYVVEWFARVANEFAVGDLRLQSLNNVQVLKGLVADQYRDGGDLNLVVQAKPTEVSNDRILLSLDLTVADNPRLHYRCTATLARESTSFNVSNDQETPSHRSSRRGTSGGISHLILAEDNVYGGVLFHGPAFQVIKNLTHSLHGQPGDVSVAGVIDQDWPTENWICDPAALDGALQLALLWTQQELAVRSLPTSIETVKLLQSPKPGTYQASLRGRNTNASKATCDVILRDGGGNIAAELLGIETHALPATS